MSNTTMEIGPKMSKEKQELVAGLDINKIVGKAQEFFGKKDKGIARQLSTGTAISRPTKDSDFVIWSGGNHWFNLTRLKGIPFGRIVEISGRPDSGKSSHALAFMKYAQDQDVIVILWDSERKFNAIRFDSQMGGKSANLLVVDSNDITVGAKSVAYFTHAIKQQKPEAKVLIVWDSVGASLNANELGTDDDEERSNQPGKTAVEVGWAIRKFTRLMNQYINRDTGEETIGILAINQVYSNIGSVGSTEKGGQTLYYLASLIVQLTRKKDLTRVKGGEKLKFGILTKARVKKNHLFDGADCVAETELVISASGVSMADEVKKSEDIKGWDDSEDSE